MSRSRRKHPFGLNISEKQDKRIANRRIRHNLKQTVESEVQPDVREYSNPYDFATDDCKRHRFDPKEWPEGMRK